MSLSREFRETAGTAVLSGVLFACGVALPLVGPPLGFFASTPLIWLTVRRGSRAGLVAAALGAALLLPAVPPPAVLFFAAEHALPGLFLGVRLARRGGIVSSSAVAACVVTALLLGGGFLFAGGSGGDPVALFERQLGAAIDELERGGGPLIPEGSGGATDGLRALFAFLGRVFPALMLLGMFLEVSINGLLAVRVLAREQPSPVPAPDYASFTLPERLIWALLPALALVWTPRREVSTVALNVALPLLGLYLVQGLSITLHLLLRLRLSRFGRLLLALAVLFQPYLLGAPLLLGLLDFRFDFRRRWPVPPPTPGSPPAT